MAAVAIAASHCLGDEHLFHDLLAMKTYRCIQCGHELQRPTQPYACPQCGRQAVGLFRVVSNATPPPLPGTEPPSGTAPSGPAFRHGGIAPPGVSQRQTRPIPPPVQTPPVPPPLVSAHRPPVPPPLRTRPLVRPKPAVEPEPPKPQRTRLTPIRPDHFVWAYPTEPPYDDEARPMRHAPVVDASGQIYLCRQRRLVALVEAEEKPQVVWEYVVGTHVPGPVVLAPDGTLRLHAADGHLHAITAAGKQAFAPVHVGKPLGWAAPLVDSSGSTWISAYDGGLIRVTAEGKVAEQRFFRSRQKLDSAGVVLDGVLYIGSEDGSLLAIPLAADRGVNRWNQAIDQGYTGGCLNSSPGVSDTGGELVVAARNGTLFGFTPAGATAWTTTLPGPLLASPVIDRHGNVYVGVSQFPRGQKGRGFLVSVDGNSHQIRWQYEAAGPMESTPAIGDDDLLYFGDNAGMIHAVDFHGNAVWTAQVEAPVRSAVTILAPERVAFGLDDDTLVVLRCASQGLSPQGWPKHLHTP